MKNIKATLPDVSEIEKARMPRVATVLARDGSLLGTLYKEKRYMVSLADLPTHVVQSFLAAEDSRFFSHFGVDPASVLRAALANFASGETEQGASTITQQLVKRLLLTPEKSYERKIKEMMLAFSLERKLTKRRILELYLNEVYFGENAYGIEAAARTYFAKSARDLTLAQAALLAGLVKSPSRLDPFKNPDLALSRRKHVLGNLFMLGWISERDFVESINEKLALARMPEKTTSEAALWYLEEVRRLLVEFLTSENLKALGVKTDKFGSDFVLENGLIVKTAMEPRHQEAAAKALVHGLERLAKSHKRTSKQGPDELPVQGAVAAIEAATGDVLALVGGYRFGDSQFNRATQARRQPGSSFKPIVYSAALDAGYTPVTDVLDGPLAFVQPSGKVWRPSNFGGGYMGWLPLHRALALSRNTVSVRLADKIGLDAVIERAKIMGFESDIPDNLSIALGAAAATPLNMACVYNVFANGGTGVKPRLILEIADAEGRVLYKPGVESWRAISPENAYIMTQMMREVVEKGTGTRAKVAGRAIAGKTGTTNKSRDAWFVGFSPDVTASVYIGRDTMEPMNSDVQGGRTAAPIFREYMEAVKDMYPTRDFERPENIVLVDGQPLTQEMKEGVEEIVKEEEKGVELDEEVLDQEDTSYHPDQRE